MAAGTWSFTIEQGATFRRTLTYTDEAGVLMPLVGLLGRMQIRASHQDTDILLELTTENGRMTLTDPGLIELFIDSDTTAGLTFKQAVHDLELYDPAPTPDDVRRLLRGDVSLSPEVTR